ncbi:MAG: enoyl-CoA hydratase/isomerase family protein [Acidobacteria bacterium]|nr:enoyl-CoA hydratase/isomerase family protein [Acidobacteriota bacterium]
MAERLKVIRTENAVEVRLDRPEVHNAFDAALIRELNETLRGLAAEPGLRVLVLSGAGPNFCAGADLHWMRESIRYTKKENEADALRLHRMLRRLYEFPRPTIARVQGGVFGGGVGLVSCCDVAVAAEDATLCLSETRLGILPAVISPFVIRKIGPAGLRAWGLSAKRMTAAEAFRIGLVNEVVPESRLDAAVAEWTGRFLENGPEAMALLKRLTTEVEGAPLGLAASKTGRAIARARAGKEGQEGMLAFLEKRPPSWRPR